MEIRLTPSNARARGWSELRLELRPASYSVVCWALVLAALLTGLGSGVARAQPEPQVSEASIKAAFLLKFADYVEWPPNAFAAPDSALTIGVMAEDDVAEELLRLASGRTVGGRPIAVRKLLRDESLAGLHIVFVGSLKGEPLGKVLSAAGGHATLTVTQSEEAFDLGSIINFVVVANKVRFDVGLRSADAASLRISARLLAVARRVVGRST